MVKKFEEFAALLYLLPFHCSVFGFIQDYPPDVVGVGIVDFVVDCLVDDVVLVIAVGHTKWGPSADQSETRRWQPTVLYELVYYHSISHKVCVSVTVELPRLSTVLVSCQYPVLPASELFPLLSDPLFLYQQSF